MKRKFFVLVLLASVIFTSCTTQSANPLNLSEKSSTETAQPQASIAQSTETSIPAPTNTPTVTPTRVPEVITDENASRLEKLVTFGHGSTRNLAAVSPDHKTIAIASTIGVVLYDTETLEQTRILETKQTTQSVAFSPDSTKLAIGMPNPLILEDKKERITSVEIWDVKSGEQLKRFEDYNQFWDIRAFAFSHDGCELIDWSDTVHNICDNTSTKKAAKDWRNPAAVFSPDGTQALVYQGRWSVWDTKQNLKLRDVVLRASLQFEGHYIIGGLPIYSPDGKTIASWQSDRIYITDSQDFKQISTYKISSVVKSLYISPDSQYLAAFGDDNKIHVVSTTTGKQVGETKVLPYVPLAVTFSSDSQFLVSVDDFTNLYQWSIPDLKIVKQRTYLPYTTQAAFSPDGKYLAITTREYSNVSRKYSPSTVEVLNAKTFEHVYTLEGWEPDPKWGIYIGGLAFSPDGKTLASSTSCTGFVYFWDMATGKLSRTLEVAPGKKLKESDLIGCIEGVAFSPDGKNLAAVNAAISRLLIWDIDSGKLNTNYALPMFSSNPYPVHPDKVSYTSDGSQVILGEGYLWDLQKKSWVEWKQRYASYPLRGLKSYSYDDEFEFNPDKTILLQSSPAGAVILWHIKQ